MRFAHYLFPALPVEVPRALLVSLLSVSCPDIIGALVLAGFISAALLPSFSAKMHHPPQFLLIPRPVAEAVVAGFYRTDPS